MNTNMQHPSPKRWQRTWLAVLAGVVTHIGVSSLLVAVALFAGNAWAVTLDSPPANWADRMNQANTFAWFVLQAISLISGLASGIAAVWFSPPRSRVALGILLALALLSVFFAQLPSPHSIAAVALWALATPVGFVLGVILCRRYVRGA